MALTVKQQQKQWEEDSKLLSQMAQRWDNVDQELFDAIIDLREQFLERLGKGVPR
jgi:hypothetical protein